MPLTNPRSTVNDPPYLPNFEGQDQAVINRQLYDVLQMVLQGYLPITGQVTLAANAATSTLTDDRIGPASKVFFTPVTANAQAIATPRVSAQARGTATLSHANDANADKTFDYVIVGI